MASGAHLTSTSARAPSIFEVIAQERLTELIPGALNQVVSTIINRHPVLATYISPDKIVLTAHSALEAYFLFAHHASAGEQFYGLERVNSSGSLTKIDKIKSLMIVSLLPYVKKRLSVYENDPSKNSRSWKLFWKIYPYLCGCVQTVDFILNIGYLMDKTRYQSLEQLVSGTVLQRATPKEEKSKLGVLRVMGSVLTYSVTVGVFFIQFLQWWQNQPRDALNDVPIPDPPVHLREGSRSCPICGNDIVNPAALSTSGFIFCYPCVYKSVVQTGKCPVTRIPSSIDSLIRLHTTGS